MDYPIIVPKIFNTEYEKYIKASLRTLHYGNVSVDHVLKRYYSDFDEKCNKEKNLGKRVSFTNMKN